jgi:hypothetical protein
MEPSLKTQAISRSDVLTIWERAAGLHPLDRALVLLEAATPGNRSDPVADWPLGSRNSALAEFRCALFGPAMQGWVSCPHCAEKLDFQLDARTFIGLPHREQVTSHGHTFRLPTSRDLAAVADESDSDAAAVRLLERCCLDPDDTQVWSEADVDEIGEELAAADGMAEMRLAFSCANCRRDWQEILDIVQFIWTEINATAQRYLHDVDALARAYGWTEQEILDLSDARRSFYLGMVQQ